MKEVLTVREKKKTAGKLLRGKPTQDGPTLKEKGKKIRAHSTSAAAPSAADPVQRLVEGEESPLSVKDFFRKEKRPEQLIERGQTEMKKPSGAKPVVAAIQGFNLGEKKRSASRTGRKGRKWSDGIGLQRRLMYAVERAGKGKVRENP